MIRLNIADDKARTMTKAEYKAARRWCRIVAKITAAHLEQHQKAMAKVLDDMAAYGSGTYIATGVKEDPCV